jgi:hypothetical protein
MTSDAGYFLYSTVDDLFPLERQFRPEVVTAAGQKQDGLALRAAPPTPHRGYLNDNVDFRKKRSERSA